ncbi:glycosyltransferase [Geminicoccaceae bacterium 1502E]|nr:glycosyltransferase [Geminicoccaceae bacterium 1502E]
MRIGLVHDYLTQYGGAERVLDEFKSTFPEAPVFVAVADLEHMPPHYRSWDIRTSWLQQVPYLRRDPRKLLPLLPLAFETFDFTGFDVLLASSSGFCHGALTGEKTCQITYCHSPPRFVWDYATYARREALSGGLRAALRPMLKGLRQWDMTSASRTDFWLASSRAVQQRIAKHYRRSSTVLWPPVDVGRFDATAEHDGYFLMLMRLVGWKRPDIVVEACTRLGARLVVAGDGRELATLRRLAGPTVEFVGRVDDVQMRRLYARCAAFILPSEEDFGITPLEAMASGKPVIAFAGGGALETVVPGVTGMFFGQQTAESLAGALEGFEPERFDAMRIRRHAEQFDATLFRHRLRELVAASHRAYRRSVPLPEQAGAVPALAAE